LIPRTGTGEVIHKINTYGTGDGEYHIVMEEIKTSSHTPGHSLLSKLNSP